MNKFVLEHYPASKLPEELREGLPANASVKVTIEEQVGSLPMTRDEFLESLREARHNAPGVTLGEAVARIRKLRDEWDD